MLADLRYALRQCRRNPGVAAASILTLALGIGANTAIFSVVDAALFKPLPFLDPQELVDIALVERRGQAEETFHMGALTWDRIAAFRSRPQVFAGIEPYGRGRVLTRTDGDGAHSLRVGRLSPRMLALLGLAPRLGRGLTEDEAARGAPVALLSEGFWSRAFGGDAGALGRTLEIDKGTYTIVGVAPGALSATPFDQTDVWLPMAERIDPQQPRSTGADVIARIRPGLSLEQAERELDRAAEAIQLERPARRPWEADLVPLDRDRGGEMGSTLLVLLGAVAFVLLIACANVANLMLSRFVARGREVTIRLSIGATRLQLARLFLVEGSVLAIIGGVLALFLAWWIVQAMPALVPDQMYLFGRHRPELDLRVLAFATGAVVLAGVLTSVGPAWRAAGRRTSSWSPWHHERSTRVRAQSRTRSAFVVLQVSLTLVLLAGAGLMVNSFVRMLTADPGFEIENLAFVDIGLPPETYADRVSQDQFFMDFLEVVSALPGVKDASFGTPPPSGGTGRFVVEGREDIADASPALTINHVDPGYFGVAGIPLKRGRSFGTDDRASTPPAGVIDENAARRFWPGQEAIGRRFRYSPYVPWITVVGIAGSVKTQSFTNPRGSIQIYLPLTQEASAPFRTLLLRTTGEPAVVFNSLRAIVRRLDSRVSIGRAGLVADLYERTTKTPQFFASLMSLFAGIGLVTAAVGLYGILSYAVAQRTQEIGVRMALGANASDVRRMVISGGLRPVVAGLVVGTVGASWLTRLLSSQLYGVSANDPMTLSAAILFLLLVAVMASALPARRATRVDPVVALRTE